MIKYAILRPDGALVPGIITDTELDAKASMERHSFKPWASSRLRGYKLAKLVISIVDTDEDL